MFVVLQPHIRTIRRNLNGYGNLDLKVANRHTEMASIAGEDKKRSSSLLKTCSEALNPVNSRVKKTIT